MQVYANIYQVLASCNDLENICNEAGEIFFGLKYTSEGQLLFYYLQIILLFMYLDRTKPAKHR